MKTVTKQAHNNEVNAIVNAKGLEKGKALTELQVKAVEVTVDKKNVDAQLLSLTKIVSDIVSTSNLPLAPFRVDKSQKVATALSTLALFNVETVLKATLNGGRFTYASVRNKLLNRRVAFMSAVDFEAIAQNSERIQVLQKGFKDGNLSFRDLLTALLNLEQSEALDMLSTRKETRPISSSFALIIKANDEELFTMMGLDALFIEDVAKVETSEKLSA